jgi:signal transduction histidine kinase
MTTAEGRKRWVRSIAASIVENGEVIALYGALQDITQRKEREEQLERQNERLDQFASLVSHDLRGPLNVLKGRLALAQKEDDSSHLAAAERAIDRMDGIIEDLLTLTWGGQEIEPDDLESQSLSTIAQASWGCVDTAQATLQLNGARSLEAHEGRLRRLLENLFRNAVEHAGEDVTVRVGMLDEGFYVEDDGPGIPEDKREKVLEGGYSSREEGTGLGLSIAQAIAETHGWALSVTQSEEGGARFEFQGVSLGDEESAISS